MSDQSNPPGTGSAGKGESPGTGQEGTSQATTETNHIAPQANELTSLVANAQETLERLNSEHERFSRLVSDANQRLADLDSEIDAVRSASTDAKDAARDASRIKSNIDADAVIEKVKEIDSGAANLKAHEKALATMLATATATAELLETQKTEALANVDAITKIKTDLAALLSESKTSRGALEVEERAVGDKLTALQSDIDRLGVEKDAFQGLITKIQEIEKSADKNRQNAINDAKAITEAKQNFSELLTTCQSAQTALDLQFGKANAKIAEIEAAYTKITTQHGVLFDDRAVGGVQTRSVVNSILDIQKDFIAALVAAKKDTLETKEHLAQTVHTAESDLEGKKADFKQQLASLLADSNTSVATLKANLESEIRQLLPGAGAAKLAWAYFDAKSKYGPTKFDYTGDLKKKLGGLRFVLAWISHVVEITHLDYFLRYVCCATREHRLFIPRPS